MLLILLIREVVLMIFLPILALIFAQWLESKYLNQREASCLRLGMILGAIMIAGTYLLTRGG
jgi:hypothetical protein